MPILLDRRDFLGAALAATLTSSARAQTKPAERVRWALLSDTHCPTDEHDTFRGFQPAANLTVAVKQASESTFDQYLVNGDLARLRGQPSDYQRFADGTAPLSAKSPLALLLGNHDDRKNAIAAFTSTAGTKETVPGKWVSIVESGPLRMILLDSLFQTNEVAGLLGKAQRDWLDEYLRKPADKPTLIFVHHTLDDSDGSMLDADRFLNVVGPRRQVKAVFYGHSHAYKYEVRNGLHLVNLPAVGYNFADDQPVGWVESEMDSRGAQLTLHAFAGTRTEDGRTRKLEWRE